MSEQQIEGVPAGWRLVAIRHAVAGDYFLNTRGLPEPWTLNVSSGSVFAIIRKIEKPKQFRQFANAAEFEPHRDRWWRFKDENDELFSTYYYSNNYHMCHDWRQSFDEKVFDDGSPFGVEVTE